MFDIAGLKTRLMFSQGVANAALKRRTTHSNKPGGEVRKADSSQAEARSERRE
jgi:hypothetical protein